MGSQYKAERYEVEVPDQCCESHVEKIWKWETPKGFLYYRRIIKNNIFRKLLHLKVVPPNWVFLTVTS